MSRIAYLSTASTTLVSESCCQRATILVYYTDNFTSFWWRSTTRAEALHKSDTERYQIMGVHVHEHCLKMARRDDGTPWWSAFPEPASSPAKIAASEVAQLLQGRDLRKPHGFLLVDTRRTDCIGGTIQGSLNLPAHSFYLMRAMLHDLCKQAGIQRIIFYCGSSNGRGPRCAAWMQDYINSLSDGHGSDYESDSGCAPEMATQVMTGGIRGWVKAYGGGMMEGYDEKTWQDPKPDEETR